MIVKCLNCGVKNRISDTPSIGKYLCGKCKQMITIPQTTRKPIQYWVAKARLAGMLGSFPIALVLLSGGFLIWEEAGSHLTPYSVSVRGYYSQDGTYVRPHHRRPPGSVEHDRPYESQRIIGTWMMIFGLCLAVRAIYRFKLKSDMDLLPPLDYVSDLPPPPRNIRIPECAARARKLWHCQNCHKTIYPGQEYYYYTSPGTYYGARYYEERHRFCFDCRVLLEQEKKVEGEKRTTYNEAVAKDVEKRRILKIQQYRQYFGIDPEK